MVKSRCLVLMVEAVQTQYHLLLAHGQEIAGASHDFVTDFRLRSETKIKQSNYSWTQPVREPGTGTD